MDSSVTYFYYIILLSFFLDKKGVDTRLQGAQNALLLQEDTIRRSERERKTMLDQITGLERQILAMENEKKQGMSKYVFMLLCMLIILFILFIFALFYYILSVIFTYTFITLPVIR